MSGQRDDRVAEGEKEIVALGRGALQFNAAIVASGERGEVRMKKIDDRLLVPGSGIEINEGAS